MQHM